MNRFSAARGDWRWSSIAANGKLDELEALTRLSSFAAKDVFSAKPLQWNAAASTVTGSP